MLSSASFYAWRRRLVAPPSAARPRRGNRTRQAQPPFWVRQGDLVRPLEVSIGLSDGVVTEVSGDDLLEGTEVVVVANRIEDDADALSILPHTWSR